LHRADRGVDLASFYSPDLGEIDSRQIGHGFQGQILGMPHGTEVKTKGYQQFFISNPIH
jgi:hypothetical protein